MVSKKLQLPRRTLLRGMVGGALATVALPPLEAMMNGNGTALADGSDRPIRFMTWFFGNGVVMDRFEPTTTGPDYELTEELMPLADVREYVSVLTGLKNRIASEQKITHHEGMVAFTGHPLTEISGLASRPGGPTIDQVIADIIMASTPTPIHSVHVGVSKRMSVMDGGTTLFAASHRGPNEPQFPERNPQAVWQLLFGEFVPKPDDRDLRLSILDAVREDVSRLRPRLGSADNIRLDAHLESVSALENKISAIQPVCTIPEMPTEANEDEDFQEPITSVNEAMSQLLAYAFICDITRVGTMLFSGGAAETIFDEIGQDEVHHNNTHGPSMNVQNIVNDAVVYIMENFGRMLQIFRDTEDLDGKNLLDTSAIYCSSDCSVGWSHSVDRQPIIVAGHARNSLVHPGIHYQAIAPNPPQYTDADGNISDVLLTLAQIFDPDLGEIGSGPPMSSTPLDALKAR